MMDWAILETNRILLHGAGEFKSDIVQAALRKAKADGLTDAAAIVVGIRYPVSPVTIQHIINEILAKARRIKKGEPNDPDEGLPTAEDVRGILKG